MTTLLDRFAASLDPRRSHVLADVRHYVAWRLQHSDRAFAPSASDDVEIRTYLLHLRSFGAGTRATALERRLASLRLFYEWARGEGLIASSPFAVFDFNRPLLSRDQIRRREETLAGNAREREIARLRAINRVAEHLNRSAGLQTALGATLETLAEVMGLKCGWAFLLTDSGLTAYLPSASAPHDFAVAAACGLPPALEDQDRRYLCQPPDCHCQALLRSARLTRAVNVVECTRLRAAASAAGDTRGLLFHATVPLLWQGKALGILNLAAEEWQFLTAFDLHLLSAIGNQVAAALERARLYEASRAQHAQLQEELQMARAVQAHLLPDRLPEIPGFSLAAEWRSAGAVAGDLFDVFPLSDGRWAIVVADVSGKGAPAALYMAMVRSLVRSRAEHTRDPAATLGDVDATLRAQASSGMFVTAYYGVFDPADSTVVHANAGHNPPLVRRRAAPIEELSRGGMALGLNLGELGLANRVLELAPGEALVVYTDGVTDAENAKGEMYGNERLAAAIAGAPASAGETLAGLMSDLARFTGSVPQPDDITIVVLARDLSPE